MSIKDLLNVNDLKFHEIQEIDYSDNKIKYKFNNEWFEYKPAIMFDYATCNLIKYVIKNNLLTEKKISTIMDTEIEYIKEIVEK